MNTFTAPFVQTSRTGTAVAAAALGGLATDAVTGSVLLATAGADGALVTRVTAMPRGTVTATSLRLFVAKANAPTIYRPVDSELMAAYTNAATTATPETNFGNIAPDSPLRLEAGDKLYAGIEVALPAGVCFFCEWADF